MPLERQSPSGSTGPIAYPANPVSTIDTFPTIAAIIPAFNEAKMIGGVLEVLHRVDSLNEIIVVDDGSKDATSKIVQKFSERDGRLRLIRNPKNLGKGQAVFTGFRATQAPYLLMLDADLIHITPQHVLDLMQPVLEGQADMTLGLFRGGYWATDLAHALTPWLTGQRCLRAELCKSISGRAAAGYGLETAMTVAAHQHGWRCQKVILHGAMHPPGEMHRGILRGFLNRGKMYLTIGVAWCLAGGVREIFHRPVSAKRSARDNGRSPEG
jgi:hypothetical protein